MEFALRVADKAATYRPARALLTLIALPFFVLGALAAVVWLAGTWVWAAMVTGFVDTRARNGGLEAPEL